MAPPLRTARQRLAGRLVVGDRLRIVDDAGEQDGVRVVVADHGDEGAVDAHVPRDLARVEAGRLEADAGDSGGLGAFLGDLLEGLVLDLGDEHAAVDAGEVGARRKRFRHAELLEALVERDVILHLVARQPQMTVARHQRAVAADEAGAGERVEHVIDALVGARQDEGHLHAPALAEGQADHLVVVGLRVVHVPAAEHERNLAVARDASEVLQVGELLVEGHRPRCLEVGRLEQHQDGGRAELVDDLGDPVLGLLGAPAVDVIDGLASAEIGDVHFGAENRAVGGQEVRIDLDALASPDRAGEAELDIERVAAQVADEVAEGLVDELRIAVVRHAERLEDSGTRLATGTGEGAAEAEGDAGRRHEHILPRTSLGLFTQESEAEVGGGGKKANTGHRCVLVSIG